MTWRAESLTTRAVQEAHIMKRSRSPRTCYAVVAVTLTALAGCAGAPSTAPATTAQLGQAPTYSLMAVGVTRDKLKGTTKTQGDFNLAHRFTLEMDGKNVGGIRQVLLGGPLTAALASRHVLIDHKPGVARSFVLRLAPDWQQQAPQLYHWFKTVLDGRVERKSVSVIFHNDAGAEAGRINFYECWPTKWVGPSLNARKATGHTEAIEIHYERFEMK